MGPELVIPKNLKLLIQSKGKSYLCEELTASRFFHLKKTLMKIFEIFAKQNSK